jgi:translation initiation factor 2-alpha kinase 4
LKFQVEEAELQEMVKHTLANHTSKSYRHLIDACLSQNMDIKRDIIYDMDLPNTIHVAKKFFLKQEYVRKVTQRVFQRHGALQVPLPQLLPKGKFFL